jgi:hypothetical protein
MREAFENFYEDISGHKPHWWPETESYSPKIAQIAWEAWQAALQPNDMNDWRNWREGDRVEYFGCTSSFIGANCFIGAIADDNDRRFRVHVADTDYFMWSYPHEIMFHSRPKQQSNTAAKRGHGK